MMIDVTVTVVFHSEQGFVIPALHSMRELVEKAKKSGLKLETRAVLDKADPKTRYLVSLYGEWLDDVVEVDHGDLSAARMTGVERSKGEYLAFLDGDDLWDDGWIDKSYARASKDEESKCSVWHPSHIFYFSEKDFERHSVNSYPSPSCGSFFMEQPDSKKDADIRNSLFINNIWTANAFAHRSIHERFPYKLFERAKGFGIEDWSWNIETIWNDVHHRIVSDTVHLIRVKETGSLGAQNTQDRLLIHLPEYARPIVGKKT